MGAGLGNDVAMLTDGRFSGGSHVSMGLYAEKNDDVLTCMIYRVSLLDMLPLKLKWVVPSVW